MSEERPPDDVPRVVKPHTTGYKHLPLIAVADNELVMESGIILPAAELPKLILTETSSIIVCQGFGPHLQNLRIAFRGKENFQYRVTPRTTHQRNGTGERFTRIQDAIINFVGFAGIETYGCKGGRKRTRYHYPIDPVAFVRMSIDELYPGPESRIHKLLRFGTEVREFCKCHNLRIKPTSGGLAAQLLKDPRFYPEPRRKIPGLVNASARPHLPGNCYRLHADESPKTYNAVYLDMRNAHHEAASKIQFPSANHLHAYGRWAEETPSKPFISLSRSQPHDLLTRLGLFHLGIRVPHVPNEHFPPPFMQRPGFHQVWIYSNELELIDEHKGEIDAIYSAFVSPVRDFGLSRYAKWAIRQIDAYPECKPWLKPTLHSVYGVLAAHPSPFETGYLHAKGKRLKPKDYPMGRVSIPVMAHCTDKEIESQIVNVIHRGMIEAEVRKQSLSLAREMTTNGYNVLNIYADSIFIEGNKVPFLSHPWRVEEFCTGLRFLNASSFISDQFSRLPGVSRRLQKGLSPPSSAHRSRASKHDPDWHENLVGGFQMSSRSDTLLG